MPNVAQSTARTVQDYIDELPMWPDGTHLRSNPMTTMQWRIWMLAAAGKFFEGFVVFMTGVALPLIARQFNLTAGQNGFISAASLCGILIGAVGLGSLSDRYGRKSMFIVEMIIFTSFLGAAVFCTNFVSLVICLFGLGLALGGELDGVDPGALELAGRGQGDVQDDAHVEVAVGGEVVIASEVADAVGDQVPVVELHAAHDVRAARDDQAGARVDRHVGERLGIAPVLAQVVLLLAGHVIGGRALRAGVHVDHDNARLVARLLDQILGGGQVEQAGVVVVRREGQERHLDPVGLDQGDLTGQPGLGQARRTDGRHGLGLSRGAEVEDVVVRVVEDGEPGGLEVLHVARWDLEGVAGRARPGWPRRAG